MSQSGGNNGKGGGGSGSPIETLTGNTGGPVPPTGFNVNVVGDGTTIDVAGSPGTSTLTISAIGPALVDLHVAKLIVNSIPNAGGNYTTIASAIAAASSGDTIFIMPGSTGVYTENVTLPANVNLTAFPCDGYTPNVTIKGKITCATAGTRSISGIRLETNGDNFLALTAGSPVVWLVNCFLSSTNATGMAVAGALFCRYCTATSTGGIAHFAATSGGVNISNCDFLASGGTNTLTGATTLFMMNSIFVGNITTSDTSVLEISTSRIEGQVTANGTSVNDYITNSMISVGVSAVFCLSVGAGASLGFISSSVECGTANAIVGAGTVKYSGVSFYRTASAITTTTQLPTVMSNNAVAVKTPGAYPYTTIPQDNVILVDTSAARTIIPLASPQTGQIHRIKDNVGSAAANNITVTPSGKNIDGSASFLINTNYGSIDIVFNGTQWNIL